jgi:hypothetical protein
MPTSRTYEPTALINAWRNFPGASGTMVFEFVQTLVSLDADAHEFRSSDILSVEAAWGYTDSDFYWLGGFVVELRDGRRAYVLAFCDSDIESAATVKAEMLGQRVPFSRLSSHGIAGGRPLAWQQAPQAINEFLRHLQMAASSPLVVVEQSPTARPAQTVRTSRDSEGRHVKTALSNPAMTLNPTARATARRNVAERINRFLNGLHRARRLPNRRESFWLRHALVNLQEGQYPAGEEAMDKAERTLPIPEHAANDLSTNTGVTVEQLRGQLDLIMKAEE